MKNEKCKLTEEARKQDVSVLTVIRNALERTEGNVSAAARKLKCSPQAIYYHLNRSGASVQRVIIRDNGKR